MDEEADEFAEKIGRSATRKIRAKEQAKNPVWQGLGLMGMVGWSVAVPTIAGAFLGQWLDSRDPEGARSWTLVLIAAGVALGCINAWRWVAKESAHNRDIRHATKRMKNSITKIMRKNTGKSGK